MSSNNVVNLNGTENDEGNDRDDDDCDNDDNDNDDDERRTICSSSSGGCGVGALGGSSSCFSRAGTAFAARRVSVSRSLLRTWELLAVEVSRHLGNLVAVEEEEVMVTELGGEVEVDKEERKTLMC